MCFAMVRSCSWKDATPEGSGEAERSVRETAGCGVMRCDAMRCAAWSLCRPRLPVSWAFPLFKL